MIVDGEDFTNFFDRRADIEFRFVELASSLMCQISFDISGDNRLYLSAIGFREDWMAIKGVESCDFAKNRFRRHSSANQNELIYDVSKNPKGIEKLKLIHRLKGNLESLE